MESDDFLNKLAAVALLLAFVPLSVAKVGIGPGVSIQQPDNSVTVNSSTKYNVSSIGVYSGSTGFEGSNFSVQNMDATASTVSFSLFNREAGYGSYVTNYTVSTSSGNNLTFEFTELIQNETYEVYNPTDRIRRKNTGDSGFYSFYFDKWETEQSFSLFNTNNSRPSIEAVSVDVNDSRDTQEISFGLSSNGDQDVDSYTGISSVTEFTNSSLKADFLFPFINTVSVNDSENLRSNEVSVDLSKTDTGHVQDTGKSSNLSTQFLGQTFSLDNGASQPVDYSLSLSVPGTLDSETTWSGELGPGSSVSHVAGNKGDWLEEAQYGFQVPSEITLSEDYTGRRKVEVEERLGVSWSDIDTTGFVDTPATCSQKNQSSISVSAGSVENRTTGFTCDPGNIGTPAQTVVNESGYERIWLNTTLSVDSNLTENSSLVWPVKESDLKNFIERDGGSLEAMVNGKSSGVSAVDASEKVYVTVEDDFGNSSLHRGTHDAALTYTIGDDDSSSSSDGSTGGSFPGGSTEDNENESVDYSIDFTTQDYYTMAPGSTSRIYFTAWNYEKEENTVRISAPDTTACSYFNVQSNFVGDEFDKKSSLTLPGTRQDLGSGGSDIVLMAKVQLPNRTELQTKGLGDTFTCSFETGAGKGQAGPLNLTVKAVDTTPRWVKGVRQLVPDLPSTSFVESREICLPDGSEGASRLQQVQEYNETGRCSGELVRVPLPTGEASLLILAGFVFVAWYTKYKN